MEHSDDTRLVTISGAEYDLLLRAKAELFSLITAYDTAMEKLSDTKWRNNA